MKKLLFIALLTTSTAAYAADTASSAPATKEAAVQQKFDQTKSKRLEKINARIAELQKAQSCVEAATDYNGLAGCDLPRFKARMAKKAAVTGK